MSLSSIFAPAPKGKFDTDLFDIGRPEAEAEASRKDVPSLIDYFEDYLGIAPQIDDGKFIVVGRKGAGKSAFAEYLRALAQGNSNLHVDFIRRSELALQASIHKEANGADSKVFFEWQMLLKIVKYIINFKSAFMDKHAEKLEKFYNTNSGMVSITGKDVKSITSEKKLGVNIAYFKGIFEAVCGRKMSIVEEQAPFYKLIPDLKQFVVSCLQEERNSSSGNQAYIFIDDLDIDFKSYEESTVMAIAELIRIVKEYNNDVLSDLNVKFIILIRDDIIDFLDTHTADMNKIISSYGIRLEWYAYDIFMKDIESLPLKRLINRRIQKNFERLGKEFKDPWISFTGDENNIIFKQIIDITFARPRDLIQYFMNIKSLKRNFPLQQDSLKRLDKSYTNSVVSEIKNELTNFFHPFQINTVFSALAKISRRDCTKPFSKELLTREIQSEKFNGNIDDAIGYLFDRSVIGHFDGNTEVRFKYRCSHSYYGVDESNLFTLHKAVYKYFQTR